MSEKSSGTVVVIDGGGGAPRGLAIGLVAGLALAAAIAYAVKSADEKARSVGKDGILPTVRDALGLGEDEASKQARIKREADEKASAAASADKLSQAFKDYTAAHPDGVGKAAGGTAVEGTADKPEEAGGVVDYVKSALARWWDL